MSTSEWIPETLVPGVRTEYESTRVLERRAGSEQELVVFDNPRFGRMLMIDGAVQTTTADEFVYHEMMAHVPLLAHGRAADVLIIGGGDCGLAEEVLKHPCVTRLTQVEIDAAVVEIARKHFASMNERVFADPRFQLEIGDGARFVAQTDKRFDVVMVDSTDPVGPGKVLFTESFYRDVLRCLKSDGVLVAQCGVPFLQRSEFTSAMKALSAVFPYTTCYVAAVPTYTGGHLALAWASNGFKPDVPAEKLALRAEAINLTTSYYTPEVHRAAFALPRYIADAIRQASVRE